jgi:hypothetical protein
VTDTPQTAAGAQAAKDKAEAAARFAQNGGQAAAPDPAATAAADQAAAEANRQRTAAARKARAAARPADPEPADTTVWAAAAAEPEAPAEPAGGPCAECREGQAELFARIGRVETAVQAIGKFILAAAIGAAIVYVMADRKPASQAEIES